MESFESHTEIVNGVKLYKEDLIELEELMKHGDETTEYGISSFENGHRFICKFKYLKDSTQATFEIGSMKDLDIEYENIELIYLSIEKTEVGNNSYKKHISLTFRKNTADLILMGEDMYWVKMKEMLMLDFLNKRQSKTGKYNNWISHKLTWYMSPIAGIFIGTGLGNSKPLLIYSAILIVSLVLLLSYPPLLNKLFPKYLISFKKKEEDVKNSKKEDDVRAIYLSVIAGIITSIITYLVTLIF